MHSAGVFSTHSGRAGFLHVVAAIDIAEAAAVYAKEAKAIINL